MPSFACKDLGMECGWTTKDKTEAGLMKKIADHAKKAHNMTSMDAAMMDKVKAAIKQ